MRYAFIFPGQGSQAQGMGKDFFDSFLVAKECFEQASDLLKKDINKLLFQENDELNQTQWTQPAIFLISFIAHKIFQSEFPLLPVAGLGHSLGEISALSTAQGLSFEHAIKLTHLRGQMMMQACEGKEAGMMVVMGLKSEVLESFTQEQREKAHQEIWCANYNGEDQIVLAGKKADLIQNEEKLKSLGAKRALLLPMSVASHCPMLESMRQDFEALLEELLEEKCVNPIISNATTQAYQTKQEAKKLLSKQLISPVLYRQSIQSLNEKVDGFIEFGHGNVLSGLNKRLGTKTTLNIKDSQSLKESITILNKENE